jgi:YidC/Oxa1 family membrane protein insertase
MDLLLELFHLLLVIPMTNVLVGIAHLFNGNFGIAIIIFTLFMKLITWPLTASQYKATRAMQAIQPRLQELQKKYKGKDPKKLQSETMALYREAGVNPIGCLFPLLVQFPIWIALYQVINVSLGETPESLVSLSQRLYPVPFIHSAVPLDNEFLLWNLGARDSTYILPILVALTMYVQQKMITPTPSAAPVTPQQAQQQQTQQMMTWMMPLIFGYMSVNFASGLALYWAVSNVAGIALQYFYVGRKVDWGGMLRFGPPAPAKALQPARERAQKREAAQKRESAPPADDEDTDNGEDAAANGASEDTTPGVTSDTTGRTARRKRHGRRRGKR